MASKIFVLCALACAFQGLNGALVRPSVLPSESVESDLYKDSINRFKAMEAEYAGIIDKFENVVLNTESEAPEAEFAGFFDNILESIENIDETHMAEEGAESMNVQVVRECIREQAPNFRTFVEEMRNKVTDARVQLRQLVVDTFSPYIIKAREAFQKLAQEIAQFPMKMWECIKEKDIMKAIEVIRNTRKVVADQAHEIGSTIREARSLFPVIRQKAMEMREKLRNEARAGMQIITNAIRQCIANGGPGKTLDAVPAVNVVPADQVSTLIAPPNAVYES